MVKRFLAHMSIEEHELTGFVQWICNDWPNVLLFIGACGLGLGILRGLAV